MQGAWSRREFLTQLVACGAVGRGHVGGFGAAAASEPSAVGDPTLTVIAGGPQERGRRYGRAFKDAIAAFLDREIYQKFTKKPSPKDEMLHYAGRCSKAIQDYSSLIMDELEGMAEGSGLRLEEVILITLHEEIGKRGVLPRVEHCTALAAGPPETRDGHTYVGQNWDWMESVRGLSSVLLWERPEGPSLLAYSYPGLWVGAGLNSAGVALCWTWGDRRGIPGPRVGIPSYVLIAQMLYQDTLNAAIEEARRARHAGWFTFVLADATGRLVNVEGTPERRAAEEARGHLARADFGSREITDTPAGRPVKYHPQCRRMYDLLAGGAGRLDRRTLQGFFGDHESTICKHDGTLDSMLFDCTERKAYVSRGPGCSGRWKTFGFHQT
jgi:isopenicillin-N N-acyltransferase-like protein